MCPWCPAPGPLTPFLPVILVAPLAGARPRVPTCAQRTPGGHLSAASTECTWTSHPPAHDPRAVPASADAGSPQEDTVPDTNPVTHTHDPADPAVDHDHTTADAPVALPGNPDLRQLRTRAKDLRRGVHRGVPGDMTLLARH